MRPLVIAPEVQETIRDRFMAKVAKGDDCWEWIGNRTAGGRGVMRINKVVYYAYRVAYVLEVGPLPAGMCVCHSCDNPSCVRPDHLFLGTHADNMRDMAAKGRAGRVRIEGERHHNAHTSDADVRRAREMYAAGGISQKALAELFGVTQTTISTWCRRSVRTEAAA